MDLSLSEEQRLLQESIDRFIEKDYTFTKRQQRLATELLYDQAIWQQMAEFGWLGLPFSEKAGGLGGSLVDVVLLAQGLGKGLVIEPYLAVFLAGRIMERLLGEAASSWLAGVIEGSKVPALAYAEPGSRFAPCWTETTARPAQDGYLLGGQKLLVFGASVAEELLVTARLQGEPGDVQGIGLFAVPAQTNGLQMLAYRMMHGTPGADLLLDGVMVPKSACLADDVGQTLLTVVDEATVVACGDALGSMEATFWKTLDYAKTRKQFGVPIGSFQVLQHYLVDMFMEVEQSRSITYMAAMQAAGEDPVAASQAASAAKAYVSRAATFVGQKAVQIHGGMGMTEELDIGHYFRRLTMLSSLFGDRDYHVRRFGSMQTVTTA